MSGSQSNNGTNETDTQLVEHVSQSEPRENLMAGVQTPILAGFQLNSEPSKSLSTSLDPQRQPTGSSAMLHQQSQQSTITPSASDVSFASTAMYPYSAPMAWSAPGMNQQWPLYQPPPATGQGTMNSTAAGSSVSVAHPHHMLDYAALGYSGLPLRPPFPATAASVMQTPHLSSAVPPASISKFRAPSPGLSTPRVSRAESVCNADKSSPTDSLLDATQSHHSSKESVSAVPSRAEIKQRRKKRKLKEAMQDDFKTERIAREDPSAKKRKEREDINAGGLYTGQSGQLGQMHFWQTSTQSCQTPKVSRGSHSSKSHRSHRSTSSSKSRSKGSVKSRKRKSKLSVPIDDKYHNYQQMSTAQVIDKAGQTFGSRTTKEQKAWNHLKWFMYLDVVFENDTTNAIHAYIDSFDTLIEQVDHSLTSTKWSFGRPFGWPWQMNQKETILFNKTIHRSLMIEENDTGLHPELSSKVNSLSLRAWEAALKMLSGSERSVIRKYFLKKPPPSAIRLALLLDKRLIQVPVMRVNEEFECVLTTLGTHVWIKLIECPMDYMTTVMMHLWYDALLYSQLYDAPSVALSGEELFNRAPCVSRCPTDFTAYWNERLEQIKSYMQNNVIDVYRWQCILHFMVSVSTQYVDKGLFYRGNGRDKFDIAKLLNSEQYIRFSRVCIWKSLCFGGVINAMGSSVIFAEHAFTSVMAAQIGSSDFFGHWTHEIQTISKWSVSNGWFHGRQQLNDNLIVNLKERGDLLVSFNEYFGKGENKGVLWKQNLHHLFSSVTWKSFKNDYYRTMLVSLGFRKGLFPETLKTMCEKPSPQSIQNAMRILKLYHYPIVDGDCSMIKLNLSAVSLWEPVLSAVHASADQIRLHDCFQHCQKIIGKVRSTVTYNLNYSDCSKIKKSDSPDLEIVGTCKKRTKHSSLKKLQSEDNEWCPSFDTLFNGVLSLTRFEHSFRRLTLNSVPAAIIRNMQSIAMGSVISDRSIHDFFEQLFKGVTDEDVALDLLTLSLLWIDSHTSDLSRRTRFWDIGLSQVTHVRYAMMDPDTPVCAVLTNVDLKQWGLFMKQRMNVECYTLLKNDVYLMEIAPTMLAFMQDLLGFKLWESVPAFLSERKPINFLKLDQRHSGMYDYWMAERLMCRGLESFRRGFEYASVQTLQVICSDRVNRIVWLIWRWIGKLLPPSAKNAHTWPISSILKHFLSDRSMKELSGIQTREEQVSSIRKDFGRRLIYLMDHSRDGILHKLMLVGSQSFILEHALVMFTHEILHWLCVETLTVQWVRERDSVQEWLKQVSQMDVHTGQLSNKDIAFCWNAHTVNLPFNHRATDAHIQSLLDMVMFLSVLPDNMVAPLIKTTLTQAIGVRNDQGLLHVFTKKSQTTEGINGDISHYLDFAASAMMGSESRSIATVSPIYPKYCDLKEYVVGFVKYRKPISHKDRRKECPAFLKDFSSVFWKKLKEQWDPLDWTFADEIRLDAATHMEIANGFQMDPKSATLIRYAVPHPGDYPYKRRKGGYLLPGVRIQIEEECWIGFLMDDSFQDYVNDSIEWIYLLKCSVNLTEEMEVIHQYFHPRTSSAIFCEEKMHQLCKYHEPSVLLSNMGEQFSKEHFLQAFCAMRALTNSLDLEPSFLDLCGTLASWSALSPHVFTQAMLLGEKDGLAGSKEKDNAADEAVSMEESTESVDLCVNWKQVNRGQYSLSAVELGGIIQNIVEQLNDREPHYSRTMAVAVGRGKMDALGWRIAGYLILRRELWEICQKVRLKHRNRDNVCHEHGVIGALTTEILTYVCPTVRISPDVSENRSWVSDRFPLMARAVPMHTLVGISPMNFKRSLLGSTQLNVRPGSTWEQRMLERVNETDLDLSARNNNQNADFFRRIHQKHWEHYARVKGAWQTRLESRHEAAVMQRELNEQSLSEEKRCVLALKLSEHLEKMKMYSVSIKEDVYRTASDEGCAQRKVFAFEDYSVINNEQIPKARNELCYYHISDQMDDYFATLGGVPHLDAIRELDWRNRRDTRIYRFLTDGLDDFLKSYTHAHYNGRVRKVVTDSEAAAQQLLPKIHFLRAELKDMRRSCVGALNPLRKHPLLWKLGDDQRLRAVHLYGCERVMQERPQIRTLVWQGQLDVNHDLHTNQRDSLRLVYGLNWRHSFKNNEVYWSKPTWMIRPMTDKEYDDWIDNGGGYPEPWDADEFEDLNAPDESTPAASAISSGVEGERSLEPAQEHDNEQQFMHYAQSVPCEVLQEHTVFGDKVPAYVFFGYSTDDDLDEQSELKKMAEQRQMFFLRVWSERDEGAKYLKSRAIMHLARRIPTWTPQQINDLDKQEQRSRNRNHWLQVTHENNGNQSKLLMEELDYDGELAEWIFNHEQQAEVRRTQMEDEKQKESVSEHSILPSEESNWQDEREKMLREIQRLQNQLASQRGITEDVSMSEHT